MSDGVKALPFESGVRLYTMGRVRWHTKVTVEPTLHEGIMLMKKKKLLITGILAAVLLSGCGRASSASVSSSTAASAKVQAQTDAGVFQSSTADSEAEIRSAAADLTDGYTPAQEESMTEQQIIQVQVGDQIFTAVLEDNETAAAFRAKLPLTLQMQELNGNEKYAYGVSLPADAEAVGTIHAGDVMLYGGDCLVLFYDTFDTVYSYSRIGHIENPEGLAEAVGNGNVEITFSAQ